MSFRDRYYLIESETGQQITNKVSAGDFKPVTKQVQPNPTQEIKTTVDHIGANIVDGDNPDKVLKNAALDKRIKGPIQKSLQENHILGTDNVTEINKQKLIDLGLRPDSSKTKEAKTSKTKTQWDDLISKVGFKNTGTGTKYSQTYAKNTPLRNSKNNLGLTESLSLKFDKLIEEYAEKTSKLYHRGVGEGRGLPLVNHTQVAREMSNGVREIAVAKEHIRHGLAKATLPKEDPASTKTVGLRSDQYRTKYDVEKRKAGVAEAREERLQAQQAQQAQRG